MSSMYNDGEDTKKRAREPMMPESMHKTRRIVADHPSFSRLVAPISTTLRVDESKKANNVVPMNMGGGGGGSALSTAVGGGGGVSEEVKEWVDGWFMGWDDVSSLTNWKYDEFESYKYLVFENDDFKNDGEEIVWGFDDLWDLSLCN